MTMNTDHLYELLPAIYRLRDAERGYPLQALLRVIEEQVNVVEEDIATLYQNWFIETCQDWVVPYIGDLIGWHPVHEAGQPGNAATIRGRERNKILIPRRELANTIRYRRRKGTLALLELLALDVAGWPARAVEFFRLLEGTQNINLSHTYRGHAVDIRQGAWLDLIDGAFDKIGHTIDVRRINSNRSAGRYNIPSVGLFTCRLKSHRVTLGRAYGVEGVGLECFTFSVLGNDAPLFGAPVRETDPFGIAEEINLPVAIRREAFESREVVNHVARTQASESYYGEGKSVAIWIRRRKRGETSARELIPAAKIVPADLSGWRYRPQRDRVAVDPVLGRIAFPSTHIPKDGVWVSYHYGFSADIGGGEYARPISQVEASKLYRVGPKEQFRTINAAIRKWRKTDAVDHPRAVVEIADSGVYVEQIHVHLKKDQVLQVRAALGVRPVIRLLDWHSDRPDSLTISGESGSRFTLDGLLVSGRSVAIEGDISEVTIRHCTLVPGWTIDSNCEPHRPAEPSLELFCPLARVNIEKSILGSIQVYPLAIKAEPESQDDSRSQPKETSATAESGCYGVGYGFRVDPICLHLSDSILDAIDPVSEAIGAPGCVVAHARLTIARSTIFGQLQVHSIDLAENSIFIGKITVARSQQGCVRYSYVTPGSRTPPRHQCQPDLVTKGKLGDEKVAEETRVQPRFNERRYGRPGYCQLSDDCAEEISRGADDESEMGAFHDLYQPQRLTNLRTRLDEFTPAGMDAAIIFLN